MGKPKEEKKKNELIWIQKWRKGKEKAGANDFTTISCRSPALRLKKGKKAGPAKKKRGGVRGVNPQ